MGFSPESYTFMTMGRLQKIKSVGRVGSVISVTLRCETLRCGTFHCGNCLYIVRRVQSSNGSNCLALFYNLTFSFNNLNNSNH